MKNRIAIYARYSSDLQRDASIEDQVRIVKQQAARMDWQIVEVYSDHAISGASMNRPGLQSMLQDATNGRFDMVVTEALDRVSRDQEHVAGIYKKLKFAGVEIYSLGDGGFVNELHIGLKGTMNHMFLKDLAQKVKRGITGRIAQGKHTGDRSYGYDIVRRFNQAGEVVKGERVINKEQAVILQRIFEEYVSGKSPRLIAMDLNRENVPSPKGKGWAATTLTGKKSKGTGILNNELLIGRIVWNKNHYIKDPATDRRVSRPNPPEEWVITEVPELRIIPQALWDKAKAKQEEMACNRKPETKRRPKTLLSGLIECGCCGGGYNKMSARRYYCAAARRKATCDNHLSIRVTELESTVLSALQNNLFQPELFEAFCAEYEAKMQDLTSQQNQHIKQAKTKLEKLATQKANIMQAIKDGLPASEFKEELASIKNEREQTQALLKSVEQAPVVLKPDLAQRYLEEVSRLQENMAQGEFLHESAQLLQKIIQKVVLTPNGDKTELKIDVQGNFAGMLAVATDKDNPLPLMESLQQAQLFTNKGDLHL